MMKITKKIALLTLFTILFIALLSGQALASPTIDEGSFSISKTKASLGENVILSVKVSESYLLNRFSFDMYNIDSGKKLSLLYAKYNSASDRWEYVFTVDNKTPNGTWRVSNLYAWTSSGIVSSYFPRDKTFSVEGAAENIPPVFDLNALTIDNQTATVGDIVKFAVPLSDNTGITNPHIFIRNLESQSYSHTIIYLDYNSNTKMATGSFQVQESTASGTWIVDIIVAEDPIGNRTQQRPYTMFGNGEIPKAQTSFKVENKTGGYLPELLKTTVCRDTTMTFEVNANVSIAKPAQSKTALIKVGAYTNYKTKLEITGKENGSSKVYLCSADGNAVGYIDLTVADHIAVRDYSVSATCQNSGLTEGSHCERCQTVLKKQTVIPATKHTVVIMKEEKPTCTAPGKTEGSYCSVCGTIIKAQSEIPAIGHEIATDPEVPPTCQKKGLTEGSHCSVCHKVFTAQTAIPQIDHQYGNVKIKKDGDLYTVSYSCTMCGKEIVFSNCGKLPKRNIQVGRRAFKGSAIEGIILSDNCLALEDQAFSNCSSLKVIVIPASVRYISETAFKGSKKVLIICPEGSTAETFAIDHDMKYINN